MLTLPKSVGTYTGPIVRMHIQEDFYEVRYKCQSREKKKPSQAIIRDEIASNLLTVEELTSLANG